MLGILDRHSDFEGLSRIDKPEAFDHMQLVAVRRAIGIYEGLSVLPDGVDHERIAFVVSDRFSVPGRFYPRRSFAR